MVGKQLSTGSRPVADFAITYDSSGQLTDNYRKLYNDAGQELPLGNWGGGIHHTYDQAGAVARTFGGLTKTALDAGNYSSAPWIRGYYYDCVWNRRTGTSQSGMLQSLVNYVANLLNSYTSIGGVTEYSDANGNATAIGGGPSIALNHRDLPVTLREPNNLVTIK